ncbi:ABC transporter ATP-binding protein [Klenkia sp. PcliD-1-E]|uniref:ABC transporter ATP-binding protein n=1 Tax=Klenkia sp. PcliD-1-E TaxID=2954492 RepID=UPI002096E96D|nr:ABC transporter ATP-binding protein [Klenkia sp. PcliD-1-E]MCO7220600.1 ABC transporter ATP-binding protein [Klenkia sp. PcliD-1-E]
MSVLTATGVEVTYPGAGRPVRAVAGVDLAVEPGEVLGLVGESGCGKSSLARALVGLVAPSAGTVTFGGEPVQPLRRRARPVAQRRLQMVFQDPYSSLNARRRVGDQIADALRLAGTGGRRRDPGAAGALLERVGLDPAMQTRYPHEFSGGQRQRVAIARALAADPTVVVADEPISALDASAQAQVANLLVGLARDEGVAVVFISHDLAIVRQVADRTAVMYLGTVVEVGPTETLWTDPQHPYTRALIGAVPVPDGSGRLPEDLPGDVPDPAAPPSGCRFHPRCPVATAECPTWEPVLRVQGPGHAAACLLAPDRAGAVP